MFQLAVLRALSDRLRGLEADAEAVFDQFVLLWKLICVAWGLNHDILYVFRLGYSTAS